MIDSEVTISNKFYFWTMVPNERNVKERNVKV